MRRYWLRSTIFNLAFYIFTALACIIALPSYFLPRSAFLWIVRAYLAVNTALERLILGLSYEVRGIENLPKDGSFIVAAKHQSPYETFKLHVLFEDPAVILKKELLSIPIWGAFLKKSDVIAIDRSSREEAMNSIIEGAKRMQAQNRPVIIFPQGTRVATEETTKDKPYKFGVARLYEATALPVVPLALNAGFFYPRKGWLKRPGTVIFEFLPPIENGLKKEEFMERLQTTLEEKSIELLQDARYAEPEKPGLLPRLIFWSALLAILAGGYSFIWFKTAELIKQQFETFHIAGGERAITGPLYIKGFPGPMQIVGGEEFIQSPEGSVKIDGFVLEGFPLPFAPLHLQTSKITFTSFRYAEPFIIDSADITFSVTGLRSINITESTIKAEDFTASPTGKLWLADDEPNIDMTVALRNHEVLIQSLVRKGMVEPRSALFVSAGLSAFAREGVVNVPVTMREQIVYAGPFAILTLPGQAAALPAPNPAPSSPAPATDSLPALAP